MGTEGSNPLHRNSAKLAAVEYDPEDGLVRDAPPLVATVVNLKPSPSPDPLSSDYSTDPEPVSAGSKPKKRSRRAEPSRGDAVLIGFMGGLNHPELANRAGEEVLPQSESEMSSQALDSDVPSQIRAGSIDSTDLVGASPWSTADGASDEERRRPPTLPNGRPELPRLQTTEPRPPSTTSRHYSDAASQTL